MFSGIVEEIGRVERASRTARGLTLEIACRTVLEGTRSGDSIAVDGVCLTVSSLSSSGFSADIQPVTARLSTLGDKRVGSPVNLERSVAVGGRIGGHYVQGHVDGSGQIVSRRGEGAAIVVEIAATPEVLRYVVERGFIAVDGASLTVMSLGADRFAVSLVYHTQQHITLPGLQPGASVNLEVDVIAKYVERLIGPYQPQGVTMESLRRAGFM
jgi:riboflavin synthase